TPETTRQERGGNSPGGPDFKKKRGWYRSRRQRCRECVGGSCGWPRPSSLRGPAEQFCGLKSFASLLFSSRRRHTRWSVTGVQTCALPICRFFQEGATQGRCCCGVSRTL